jgi:Glycosyltransferase family 87
MGLRLLKLSIFQPAPLRKRLWQGGLALAIFTLTLAATNPFMSKDKALTSNEMGHDFLAFYTAGTFLRTGHADLLYDLMATRTFEHDIASQNGVDLGTTFGPFWNPPFYAWGFVPLSALPYRSALAVWTIINVTALVFAMIILCRMLVSPASRSWFAGALTHPLDWRTWTLIPLLILVSMPFIQAVSHGQNTFMSLMLLSAVVALWRNRAGLLAGAVCGLLFYKPQLAALVALMLVLTLGIRALSGLTITLGALGILTLLTMRGAAFDYVLRLPENLRYMQIEHSYLWERHVTLKGFFRLMLQGRDAGELTISTTLLWLTSTCGFAIALFASLWKSRRAVAENPWTGDTSLVRRDRVIAATIVCAPLIMPFYFDYDLLLYAIPATLLSAEMLHRPVGAERSRSDRWLLRLWIALFAWSLINPGMTRLTFVNVDVLLMSAIAGLMIARAARKPEALPAIATPIDVQRIPGVDVTIRPAA